MVAEITVQGNVMILHEVGDNGVESWEYCAIGRYSPWPQKMIYPPDEEYIKDHLDERLTEQLDQLGYSR